MDFPGFVRVLAHFRPVNEEDTRTRDPKEPEPLNSRMNKLRCELVGSPQVRPTISHAGETPPVPPTPPVSPRMTPLLLQGDLLREETQGGPTSRHAALSPVAFQLYDQDRDGKISQQEMLQVGRPLAETGPQGGVAECSGVGDGCVSGTGVQMIGLLGE